MAKRQGNRLAALQINKLAKKPGLQMTVTVCTWKPVTGGVLAVPLQIPGATKMDRARSSSQRQPDGSPRAGTASWQLILDGKDPIDVKREAVAAATVAKAKTWTFEQAALEFMATDKIEGLKSGKHKAQWLATLRTYAFPVFGNLPLQQIDSAIVLKALLAAWKKTPETGSRLRGRTEACSVGPSL